MLRKVWGTMAAGLALAACSGSPSAGDQANAAGVDGTAIAPEPNSAVAATPKADVGKIACVIERLDDTQEKAIGALAVKDLLNTGGGGVSDQSVIKPVDDYADACAKENGWTQTQRGTSRMYALAVASKTALGPELRRENMDPVKVEALYNGLTPDQQQLLRREPKALNEVIDEKSKSLGLDLASQKGGRMFGIYIAMYAMEQSSQRDFAAMK